MTRVGSGTERLEFTAPVLFFINHVVDTYLDPITHRLRFACRLAGTRVYEASPGSLLVPPLMVQLVSGQNGSHRQTA